MMMMPWKRGEQKEEEKNRRTNRRKLGMKSCLFAVKNHMEESDMSIRPFKGDQREEEEDKSPMKRRKLGMKSMTRSSWKDVPEDMLGLVLNKLHQTDRCRFRAVCKNWQATKDGFNPSCPDTPWLIHYLLPQPAHTLTCEWMDPYNKKSHQVSKSIDPDLHVHLVSPHVCYSNYDWSIVCYRSMKKLSLVLHNPFSNDLIVLPRLICGLTHEFTYTAVFTGNPASSDQSDCEVFVLVRFTTQRYCRHYFCRYRLSPSRDNEWSTQLVDTRNTIFYDRCDDMQHIDGKLYCLFYRDQQRECTLASYSLADNTWEWASVPKYDEEAGRIIHWVHYQYKRSWLTQMGGDLIMLCQNYVPYHAEFGFRPLDWVIFRFDRGHRRWVVVKDLKNTAFFMSGHRILSHAPLEDNNQDCLIFHIDVICGTDPGGCNGRGLKCYSFQQRKHVPLPEPYAWIAPISSESDLYFIPPPMITKPAPSD